jgi:alkanesulfonate monooxygenase SsuD/methylene tetrahydromethanopterin reductase-like flavin-dependent oxidoreductase (luciferase family)
LCIVVAPDAHPFARTGLALRDPVPWHELVLTVETAEQTGYEALFLPEISGREAFSTLAGLSRATYRIGLGTGVVPLDTRTPDVVAMGAVTLQEMSASRAILGIGVGTPAKGSLARLRTTILFLRTVFAGRPATLPNGESFQLTLDAGPVGIPIWVAALGPKTMRLAGELADGVLLNWCTPERVAVAAKEVRMGAETVGRNPADVTVAAYVRACVGQEDRVALAALRAPAGEYASMPGYRRQFDDSGLSEEAAKAAAAAASGAYSGVPERLVRSVCLLGDARAAASRLQEYRDAGADMPIVYPVPALETISSLEATILALAPSPRLEFEWAPPSPRWAVDWDLHDEHGG